MAQILTLPTYTDTRGKLTVIEKLLPFTVKRIYYIYEVTASRGGHKHKKTIQALICINGSCEIYVNNNGIENRYLLNTPNICLIIDPEDWHTMDNFSKDSVLLVLASEYYDKEDYIEEL